MCRRFRIFQQPVKQDIYAKVNAAENKIARGKVSNQPSRA
jgi:hypothetical protein